MSENNYEDPLTLPSVAALRARVGFMLGKFMEPLQEKGVKKTKKLRRRMFEVWDEALTEAVSRVRDKGEAYYQDQVQIETARAHEHYKQRLEELEKRYQTAFLKEIVRAREHYKQRLEELEKRYQTAFLKEIVRLKEEAYCERCRCVPQPVDPNQKDRTHWKEVAPPAPPHQAWRKEDAILTSVSDAIARAKKEGGILTSVSEALGRFELSSEWTRGEVQEKVPPSRKRNRPQVMLQEDKSKGVEADV